MKHLPQFKHKWALLIALGCFAFLVITAATISNFVRTNLVLKADRNFEIECSRIAEAINYRLGMYVLALEGVRGLFAASQTVDHNEFEAYLKRVNIAKNYPGVLNLQFVERVTEDGAEAFLNETRKYFPQFDIHPAKDGKDERYI